MKNKYYNFLNEKKINSKIDVTEEYRVDLEEICKTLSSLKRNKGDIKHSDFLVALRHKAVLFSYKSIKKGHQITAKWGENVSYHLLKDEYVDKKNFEFDYNLYQ